MYKVVYNNNCYGCFSISLKAIDWLEANCKDDNLRNVIRSLRLASKEYSFASKDECFRYDVSDWFKGRRHHKDLVAAVEYLGEEANGPDANLAIEDISSNKYRIEKCYDIENVVTPDESDWVIISD